MNRSGHGTQTRKGKSLISKHWNFERKTTLSDGAFMKWHYIVKKTTLLQLGKHFLETNLKSRKKLDSQRSWFIKDENGS